MRVSVERLRIWLLVGAGLLVLLVVGFLGVARWRAHRYLTELPAKLGVDVRQETNAFTYSQTVKGHTAFTLHAAKAIQHKDGKYTLHDVGIAVYGHGETPAPAAGQPAMPERVDRIYGKQFEFDQAAGIVKAVGEVHIDLQAPAAKDATGKMDYAAGMDLKAPQAAKPGAAAPASPLQNDHEAAKDEKLIHVKTSNLVYLQKLGVAASDEDIEFEYNGLNGHAHGAEYNTDTGLLRLMSAVKVNGLENGQPILLTASQADLDRINHRANLTDAEYLTVNSSQPDARARQTVKARHAVVQMRESGGVERITGDTGVTLTAGDAMRMTGDRGEALVNEQGKPTWAHLWGHVTYVADDETRHGNGSSNEARISFDGAGHADKIQMDGAVHVVERIAAGTKVNPQAWSERNLTAANVVMGLSTGATGKTTLHDAKATGSARLQVTDPAPGGKGTRTSSMAAEVLTASFTKAADGTSHLEQVKGTGATVLERTSELGVVDISHGDALEVHMRSAAGKGAGASQADQIASAVQQGHVVVTRHAPAKGAGIPAEDDKAVAEIASFDGATQLLTLTGHVQLTNPDGVIWADRMQVEQKTGNAAVEGGVKASYRQGSQGEMVHVLAARGQLNKAGGKAIFHGAGVTLARLWQGNSQVEAPVLEFSQKEQTLDAHGEGAGAPMSVHTVLVRAGDGVASNSAPSRVNNSKQNGLPQRVSAVRISSREMHYADASHEAQFTGGVRVESSDGVMRGEKAVALLEQPEKKAAAPVNPVQPFMAGGVERVTVTGGIDISQPGRRATGERLVYTAADGLFVLTGVVGDLPRVVDQTHGVVTGAQLSFRASDESVVVSNGGKDGSGPKVHTETRVKRDR